MTHSPKLSGLLPLCICMHMHTCKHVWLCLHTNAYSCVHLCRTINLWLMGWIHLSQFFSSPETSSPEGLQRKLRFYGLGGIWVGRMKTGGGVRALRDVEMSWEQQFIGWWIHFHPNCSEKPRKYRSMVWRQEEWEVTTVVDRGCGGHSFLQGSLGSGPRKPSQDPLSCKVALYLLKFRSISTFCLL